MSLRLGNVPTIVVSSPEAAELFLKTHDTVFASRPKIQASDYFYGPKGMAFSSYGPYWRSVRKFCTLELLSTTKIDSLAGMRREELGGLVESLKEAAVAREVVDLSEVVGGLIEDMTFKMLFGRSKDERFDLKGNIQELANVVGAFNVAEYVPFLGVFDLQGLTRRMKANYKALDKIFEIMIDEHEQYMVVMGTKKHDRDFLNELLSLKNKSTRTHEELANTIDKTNIKAIILDMITGTIDSSYTGIEWILSELIRHPNVMKKLQEEIKTIVGDTEIVEEIDLPKFKYLDMVVKESLRLHPVAPLLVPHESMEDVVINGYYIPKKSRIIFNAWALGRDPNVWSVNAENFFPERFIGSNIDLRGRDFQLLPFGSGRRGCPGMHLGLINIRLVVAQLVHCFNFVLPDDITPTKLDMDEKFGLSVARAKHLFIVPTLRQ